MLPRTPPVNWRRWVTLTCEIILRVNRIGLMPDYQSRVNTNIERQTIGGFMVNEPRMLLLTLAGGFSLVFMGISHAKVETVSQRVAPVAVGETAPDFTLEDQN